MKHKKSEQEEKQLQLLSGQREHQDVLEEQDIMLWLSDLPDSYIVEED